MIRGTAATADGLELEGWWSPPTGGRRTILYFHGNGGNIGDRDGKARPLIDRGYGLPLAGYPGYGGHPRRTSAAGPFAAGRPLLAAHSRPAGQGSRRVPHGCAPGSARGVGPRGGKGG